MNILHVDSPSLMFFLVRRHDDTTAEHHGDRVPRGMGRPVKRDISQRTLALKLLFLLETPLSIALVLLFTQALLFMLITCLKFFLVFLLLLLLLLEQSVAERPLVIQGLLQSHHFQAALLRVVEVFLCRAA